MAWGTLATFCFNVQTGMDTNPVTPAKPRRGIYLLPNLLTTGAMFSGFYAIIASIGGDYVSAVIAIFVAGLFDGLDGRVARLTNTQSEFGVQYDSLSDLVSFGVAPALVLYTWSLHSLAEYGSAWGKVGWAAAFIFAACGALRLARFNTQVGVQDKRYFQGLAIPAGAGPGDVVLWMTLYLGMTGDDVQFITPIVAVVAGLLMVSRFRYYSFKVWPQGDRVAFFWIPVALLIVVAMVINPPCVLFGVTAAYALSGPILTLWQRRARRRREAEGDVNAARPLPHDSPERRALAFLAELSQALTQSLDLTHAAARRDAHRALHEGRSGFAVPDRSEIRLARLPPLRRTRGHHRTETHRRAGRGRTYGVGRRHANRARRAERSARASERGCGNRIHHANRSCARRCAPRRARSAHWKSSIAATAACSTKTTPTSCVSSPHRPRSPSTARSSPKA